MGKWLNGARVRKREIDGKDTSYAQYAPFVYDGVMYFTRQAVTAMEHQPPGSAGMEAIYGVRPVPDADGIYPYTYNMAASAGCASVKAAKHMSVRGI